MTHKEKTVYLYGSIDMKSRFSGELPFLIDRIDALEDNLIMATRDGDYKKAYDIQKAQKHFNNMIKGIE